MEANFISNLLSFLAPTTPTIPAIPATTYPNASRPINCNVQLVPPLCSKSNNGTPEATCPAEGEFCCCASSAVPNEKHKWILCKENFENLPCDTYRVCCSNTIEMLCYLYKSQL